MPETSLLDGTKNSQYDSMLPQGLQGKKLGTLKISTDFSYVLFIDSKTVTVESGGNESWFLIGLYEINKQFS